MISSTLYNIIFISAFILMLTILYVFIVVSDKYDKTYRKERKIHEEVIDKMYGFTSNIDIEEERQRLNKEGVF